MRALLVPTIALAVLAGCTSFSFPASKKKGGAPQGLKDRGKMVRIEGGRFVMGWARGDPDEHPVHDVELSTFLIDRTEVTNGEFRECVSAGVCRGSKFMDDPLLGNDRHPVVGITWNDAKRYCRWVDKRLPTEAEWEMAARAPDFGAYPWKGSYMPTKANVRGEADGYAKTAPVGSFPDGASGNGLLDMAGNAGEWVNDWYDSVYYQKSPTTNPKGPEVSTGSRGVRGGAWNDNDYSARSSKRLGLDPNFGTDAVGFRCATQS
jgi:formylglycine-generating enzyme required for sulfatase activity